MKQYTKASSWRQWHVAVKSGSVGELIFSETKPNTFYVMNPSDGFIYVNLTTSNPSPELYEFEIEPNKADVIGRPTSTQNLYIYNHGSKDSVITIWSYDGPFDIAMLKQFKVDLKSAKFDGVISSFKASASLPYGNNHIGKVTIENEDFTNDMEEMIGVLTNLYLKLHEFKTDFLKSRYGYIHKSIKQIVLSGNTEETACDANDIATGHYINQIGLTNTGDNEVRLKIWQSNTEYCNVIVNAGYSVSDIDVTDIKKITVVASVEGESFNAQVHWYDYEIRNWS